MNEQIIKERRRTPWLILAGGLGVSLLTGLLVLSSLQPAQTDIPISGTAALQSLPGHSPTGTVLTVAGASGPVVGQPAPDFTLKTLDGQTVTLSDLRGQPVVINFWASWCAPCRLEMPALQQAYEARRAEGLVILAVNLTAQDRLAEVKTFVEELDLTMPILLDESGAVSELYRLLGLPTSIFVDGNGVIQRIHLGPMVEAQITQFMAEILE
jgi:peroxiredoxin